MSFNAVRQAIEQRMVSNWAGPATVAYENTRFDQPAGSQWLRLTVREGESETAGLKGSAIGVRRNGLIIVQVFTPAGDGTKSAREAADSVAAIFEHQRFSGITTYNASISVVGMTKDSWHQINVTIPYWSYDDV